MDVISPETLINAYAQGVFPMAEEGEILWFRPEMRGLIPLDSRFHISKSLRRSLNKSPFEIRINTAFREVMMGCSERESTWIDSVILDSYSALHELNCALSIECWDSDGLQGGIYGVHLGTAFFGESMFSRKTNASKIAMVHLVQYLRHNGYTLFDTQWVTEHLKSFGGYEVSREVYNHLLEEAVMPLLEDD